MQSSTVASKAAFHMLLHTMPVHLILQLRATQQSTCMLQSDVKACKAVLWPAKQPSTCCCTPCMNTCRTKVVLKPKKWQCSWQVSLQLAAADKACKAASTVMSESMKEGPNEQTNQ